MANVSLACGAGLIVLFFIGMCIGFIPFVGMLAILLYPLDWLLAIAAVITGALGIKQSAQFGGQGKGQAIAGMVMGLGFMLLQIGLIVLVFALGGFGVIASMMQQM